MKITVGFPTCSDPGAWWTLNCFMIGHPGFGGEFLIVDNSPAGCPIAAELEKHCKQHRNVRYIRDTGPHSSCLHKDRVFREATGDVVVCIDSHVILWPGTLNAIIGHFHDAPDSVDLMTGILMQGNGRVMATSQQLFVQEGRAVPSDAAVHHGVLCRGGQLGVWEVDQRAVGAATGEVEVDMNGSWLLAMRKAAWPGFLPEFRGFGGNEVYLCEEVRRRGGRVLIHPGVRGTHNFSTAHKKGYPVQAVDRIRNYIVGFRRLGNRDLEAATVDYFKTLWPKTVEQVIEELGEAEEEEPAPVLKAGPTTEPESRYDRLLATWKTVGGDASGAIPRVLFEHLEKIPAKQRYPDHNGVFRSTNTLEFGSGLSTLLFAELGTNHLAVEHSDQWASRLKGLGAGGSVIWSPIRGGWYDSPPLSLRNDVILIDGPPGNIGREGVLNVLPLILAFGGTIYVDDTHRPAEQALSAAIAQKCDMAAARYTDGKRAFDVLVTRFGQPTEDGPGTRLHRLFADRGIHGCGGCLKLAHYMNHWGERGCETNLDFIVSDMLPRVNVWVKTAGLFDKIKATQLVPLKLLLEVGTPLGVEKVIRHVVSGVIGKGE